MSYVSTDQNQLQNINSFPAVGEAVPVAVRFDSHYAPCGCQTSAVWPVPMEMGSRYETRSDSNDLVRKKNLKDLVNKLYGLHTEILTFWI